MSPSDPASGPVRHWQITAYRLRLTFARRRAGYAVLAGLITLIGGIALSSIQVARRTQSSYPAFLMSTDASDLTLSTYGIGSASATNYSARTAAAIARLPQVAKVESWFGAFVIPLKPDGAPNLGLTNSVNFAASNTGLYFNLDRATAVQGRLPDPGRADEFMTTAVGARIMGLHIGQRVPFGLYTPREASQPGFGTPRVPPARRLEMTLTGIVEFDNGVVQDDTDQLPANVVYTPALGRLVPVDATQGTWYGIQLSRRAGSLASTEKALLHVLPAGGLANFSVTALTEAKVERAVKPESIALGMFGLIAALAGLGAALPAISRMVQDGTEERRQLRALGLGSLATLFDGLTGVLIALVVGALGACALAAALSPLGPLGPVRRVFSPGFGPDWTVLGVGLAFFVLIPALAAVALGLRSAPQRLVSLEGRYGPRPSGLTQAALRTGLPLPGVLGLKFALEPGRGRTAVPARSVLIGAVVGVATVSATLGFAAGLHQLVTHPGLYGWNWNYSLYSLNGVPPSGLAALGQERDVAAWSGYSDTDLQVDGQTVPALLSSASPTVGPPVLSGHRPGPHQVLVGSSTLASLHKRVGDTVSISFGSPNTAPLYLRPTPVVVAGTATFPALAGSSTYADHTEMSTGMLVSAGDLGSGFVNAAQSPDPVLQGPSLVFVRFRPGVSGPAGLKDMQRIIRVSAAAFARDPNAAGDGVSVVSVQRPAEIVNYQSTGDTPELLAAGLGAGAALALALALSATVRRRRRDLALLKTLGFTGRDLGLTLLWQAAVTAGVGVAIGLPLGVAAGRQLWVLFARNIGVVPEAVIPASIGLVAAGALVLAIVVAVLPGRLAARTPAAVVLRQE